MTLGNFAFQIHERCNPKDICYMLTETGVSLTSDIIMEDIDEVHRNIDGFLYFRIEKENALGG